MATPTVYVFCDKNCKFESMTKEQIIAAIAEATGKTVTDVDEAFITKIKDQNSGNSIKFWVGSQAEYNEIVANDAIELDTFYFTDDGDMITLIRDQVEALTIAVNETDNYVRSSVAELNSQYIGLEKFVYNEYDTIRNEIRPIDKGGTGATTAKAARTNLGLGSVATKDTVPIANGGTGATSANNARKNLGFNIERQQLKLDAEGAGVAVFSGPTTSHPKIFANVVLTSDQLAIRPNITAVNHDSANGKIYVFVTADGLTGIGQFVDVCIMWIQ